MAKKTEKESVDVSSPQPQSSKVWKGQEKFEHQLFKLLPTNCLKNKSITPFRPDTYPKEHGHMFHSVDRKGQKMVHSAASAGHFHEVEVVWDGDVLVSAKCGPPIRFKYRKQRNGEMKKMKEQVAYKGMDEHGSDDVVDEHTHEVKYIRSEILSLQPQHADHTQTGNYMARKYSADVLAQAQSITKG